MFRHGPVDGIDVNTIDSKAVISIKPDSVRARVCPDCRELTAITSYECGCCGYAWPRPAPKPKHATEADAAPILTSQTTWLPVSNISFHQHRKHSDPLAPPSLRVEYLSGLSSYAEYVSFERQGYARNCAERWWFAMGGLEPVPLTVAAALERSHELDGPTAITIFRNGKFWNVDERRVRRTDGSVVEIDRHSRCWTLNSRANAAAAAQNQPINDSVPY